MKSFHLFCSSDPANCQTTVPRTMTLLRYCLQMFCGSSLPLPYPPRTQKSLSGHKDPAKSDTRRDETSRPSTWAAKAALSYLWTHCTLANLANFIFPHDNFSGYVCLLPEKEEEPRKMMMMMSVGSNCQQSFLNFGRTMTRNGYNPFICKYIDQQSKAVVRHSMNSGRHV